MMPIDPPINDDAATHGDETRADDVVLPSKTDDAVLLQSKPDTLATTPEMVHHELVSSLLSVIAEDCNLCGSNATVAEETTENLAAESVAKDETSSTQNDTNNTLATIPNEDTQTMEEEPVKSQRRSKFVWKLSKSKSMPSPSSLKCPTTPEESQRRQDLLEKVYLREQERKSQQQTAGNNKWWKRIAPNKTDVDEGIASDTDDSVSVDGQEILQIEL